MVSTLSQTLSLSPFMGIQTVSHFRINIGFETGETVDSERRGEGVADKSELSLELLQAASIAPWQTSRWVSMSFLLIMDLLHRGQ